MNYTTNQIKGIKFVFALIANHLFLSFGSPFMRYTQPNYIIALLTQKNHTDIVFGMERSTVSDREAKRKKRRLVKREQKMNETMTISNGTQTLKWPNLVMVNWTKNQKLCINVISDAATELFASSSNEYLSTYYHSIQWKVNVWRGANTCWPITWDDSFYVTH